MRSVAAAQEEIMAFAQELGQYGLRMTDISENCPKQERTLAVCHRVLSCAREYPAYLEQLIMKHSGGFKSFTKVTSPLGSIARACGFKSCRAHQLVASVISLATSFYVSHKSSSRAHSAAPRFKIATISLGCDFVFPMAKAILSFEIVTASHGFVRERSRRKRSPLGAKKRRRKR